MRSRQPVARQLDRQFANVTAPEVELQYGTLAPGGGITATINRSTTEVTVNLPNPGR